MAGDINFFSEIKQSFYNSQLFKREMMPSDVVPLNDEQYQELMTKINSGFIVQYANSSFLFVEKANSAVEERAWRDFELSRADIQLYKVQDSDPTAVGSVADWRNYRKALRALPEHANFPDESIRPVAPDANK